MNQIINTIVQFLHMGITAIFKFIQLVWTWSFGQIIAIFNSNWQALPAWKILILAVVVLAVVYVLYRALFQLWAAAAQIFTAFIALLNVLVTVLPFILIAGVIAASGAWVIQNINL